MSDGAERSSCGIIPTQRLKKYKKNLRFITKFQLLRYAQLEINSSPRAWYPLNQTLMKSKRAASDDLDRYEAALAGVKTKEDRAYELFDLSEMDKDTYNRQRKQLEEQQREYTWLMKSPKHAINNTTLETVNSIIQLANTTKSLLIHMSNDERMCLVSNLLSNRVLNNVSVRYKIIKPLPMISEISSE